MILLNMLYLLFCLPVVTIGPATAGFTKVLRNYAREEHAFLWGDFIEAFKKNFKQAFLFSLLEVLVFGFLLFDAMLIYNVTNQVMVTLSTAAILFSLVVCIFMHYYVYNMMVTFKLTLKQLLKNAFIFCWTGFLRNLILTILLVGITYFVINWHISVVLFLVATVYLSLCGFLINFTVNPLIKKHMIDGFDPETGERLEEKT
ncbi:MAG: YesL family protein [Clostridia bacterium]|nr:YesL family protein [Clostridia bacterium]